MKLRELTHEEKVRVNQVVLIDIVKVSFGVSWALLLFLSGFFLILSSGYINQIMLHFTIFVCLSGGWAINIALVIKMGKDKKKLKEFLEGEGK